ncbi:MAG: hypothetical protein EXS48_01805 [Candidatus Staskawiczbacteria bacterium]|nr:hypothetical protein [Candidatus Staskawiczbacteria bacterium]
MQNENQPNRSFGLKGIVILLLIVFALFVAYKYIASGIQEDKEKAVIQERDSVQQTGSQNTIQLQQEKSQQLNTCLTEAERKRITAVLHWTGDYYTKNCVNEVNIDAAIFCGKSVMEQVDKAKAEEQTDKQDCYDRYK